jgi:SAM-dependent methyltransferase
VWRLLDAVILRRPFASGTARRYRAARAGFGDLDARIVARIPDGARVIVDIGAGEGETARLAAAAFPSAMVLAIEPGMARPVGVPAVRARAEALPLARGSVDVALLVSSLRHVSDRRATLTELRRVVSPSGVVLIVELDPGARGERVRAHTRGMTSRWARLGFSSLVLPSAPPPKELARLACAVGFRAMWAPLAGTPFYLMELR